MSRCILITALFGFLTAAAQNDGDSRDVKPHRMILTAGGEALADTDMASAVDAEATSNPWELRKSMADPTGISQPAVDDDDGTTTPPKPAAKKHAGKVFVQEVNGSTPTGWMQMGTPPKWLLVIFDTGSDKLVAKTWDTLSSELSSIDQGIQGMVLPSKFIYNHNGSSTYRRKFMKDKKSHKKVPAKTEIAYGSGVAITDEGNDTVKIGNFKLSNFSISEITQDSLQLLHTKKGISGVLGLQHMKNRSLGRSIFSRMRDAGMFTAFGYCKGSGDNGTFLWGDDSTEGDAVEVIGEMHWAVKIGNIKINGNGSSAKSKPRPAGKYSDVITKIKAKAPAKHKSGEAPVSDPFGSLRRTGSEPDYSAEDDGTSEDAYGDEQFGEDNLDNATKVAVPCADGKCTGILDTGSNIIAGPTSVMKAFAKQANVAQDCSNFHTLPTITLDFGGQNVTIHPEGYVMKVPMPQWAKLGGHFAQGAKDSNGGDGDTSFDQGTDEGESLDQQGSGSGWKAVFEHLHKNHGIDLTPAMRDALDFENKSQPQFLCMPALVPLDKHTAFGPLYIIGTPLLQTHYARWSWGAKDKSPKIYLKELSKAKVCKSAHPTHLNMSASLEAGGATLIRSEQRLSTQPDDLSPGRGPVIRNIEDISYPHWARSLKNL